MPELLHSTLPTPVGEVGVWADLDERVLFCEFVEDPQRAPRALARRFGRASLRVREHPVSATAALAAYFDGDPGPLDAVHVDTGGTPFQAELWAALRDVPLGQTISYGALAARLGRPGGARAVGMTSGRNPVGIVLPCHRVIGADGALTGFAAGLERKRWLLEHEQRILTRRAAAAPAA
ncbi:MAG: methylated-DNA--[protein]-cysteine S-methyltransferase [Solirubrobacteraceae bacterium]